MEEEAIAVVVGLGNPGRQYEDTRHNAGFHVVDRLASHIGLSFQERKFKASWGTGTYHGRKIYLFKPLTYMNRSGEAVGEMLKYFDIEPEQMLVIHDDLDLPCGRIKIAQRGSAGGHRGVASIIQHTGTQDFPRLKLGIGRPERNEPVEAFVLQLPYPEQMEAYRRMIAESLEAARSVLELGLHMAMNRYNRKPPRSELSAES